MTYHCAVCNKHFQESQLLEQLCHDENLDHYFIWLCPDCGSEIGDIDSVDPQANARP